MNKSFSRWSFSPYTPMLVSKRVSEEGAVADILIRLRHPPATGGVALRLDTGNAEVFAALQDHQRLSARLLSMHCSYYYAIRN